jgi:tetratricopeptide (TPR) repeat protein
MQFQSTSGKLSLARWSCIGFISGLIAASSVCASDLAPTQNTTAIEPDPPCGSPALARLNENLKRIYKLEAGGHIDGAIADLRSSSEVLGECWVRAKAYVQIGRLELRLGHYKLAAEASEKAIQIQSTASALSAAEMGLAHYVRATGFVGVGEFSKAEPAYKASIFYFGKVNNVQTVVARVYSDMACMYVQVHDLRAAESAIRSSLQAYEVAGRTSAMEGAVIQDTFSHIEFRQGRLSDAMKRIKVVLDETADDKTVTPSFRAHLHEDYGNFCAQKGDLEQARISYEKSARLESELPSQNGLPRTLALVARIQILQNRFPEAEDTLRKAKSGIDSISVDNPVDAALIAETYGALLNSEHQWDDAKVALLRALSFGNGGPAFMSIRIEALQQLAEAYHHLHRKKEEKQSLKEAEWLKSQSQLPGSGQVVDLMTLQAGLRQKQ